jgi:hypothetical protein
MITIFKKTLEMNIETTHNDSHAKPPYVPNNNYASGNNVSSDLEFIDLV